MLLSVGSIMDTIGACGSDPEADRVVPVSEERCVALRKLLEETPKDEEVSEIINAALLKICDCGLHNVVRVLLECGANANVTDPSSGHTPLYFAVNRGDAALVKTLGEHGANVENMGPGHAPLFAACVKRDVECARTLLDLGAPIPPSVGFWPFLVAVFREGREDHEDLLKLLELLLERGADPDARGYMETHLFGSIGPPDNEAEEAVCRAYVDITRLLLKFGFEPRCCFHRYWPEDLEASEIEEFKESIEWLSLLHFDSLFAMAALLLERDEPFKEDHGCWDRFDVLSEALSSYVYYCPTTAEAQRLVDKANTLLDLPMVEPPLVRFTLRCVDPGAPRGLHGQVWAVDTTIASLQSMCRATVRRLLLPFPLDQKIQALPVPPLIKKILMSKSY